MGKPKPKLKKRVIVLAGCYGEFLTYCQRFPERTIHINGKVVVGDTEYVYIADRYRIMGLIFDDIRYAHGWYRNTSYDKEFMNELRYRWARTEYYKEAKKGWLKHMFAGLKKLFLNLTQRKTR